MSTISASTTSNTAFKVTSDTTGTLVLQTGAVPTTAISIDASQAVGIGTTSPGVKLDVVGGTIRSLVSGGTPIVYLNNGSTQHSIQNESGAFTFYNSGTERMRIDSSGNLGIGTTNPLYHVMILRRAGSTITAPLLNLQCNSNVLDGDSFILYGTQAANWATGVDQADSNKFRIEPNTTLGGATGLTITTAGDFGIGTTSPSVPLEVQSNSGGTGIIIRGRVSANSGTLRFYANDGTTQQAKFEANDSVVEIGSVTNVPLILYTNGAEKARITSAGDLALGTTTADIFAQGFARNSTVAVTGGGTTAAVNISGGVASRLVLGVGSTRYGQIYQDSSNYMEISTNAALPILFSPNNTERARITSAGEFIVGYSSAYATAKILGYSTAASTSVYNSWNAATSGTRYHFEFRDDTGATSRGSITTNGTATAYNTSSDYRLKNTIAPMTGALAKVALLKPCTYKWNADGSDGQGFIAHELAEVVPQCVTGEKDAVDVEGNPRYQGVDTSFLVATLTAAIQEQQVMINELKAKVAALEIK